ncbi:MAG: polysaccharide biosynthesis protein [Cypionkella sp.]
MRSLIPQFLGMSRPKKRAVQLLADSLILFTVFMVSMWLRLDRTWFLDEPRFWGAMLIVIPLSLAVFVKLGFYRAVVRYIAGRALGVIFLGALASGIFLSLVSWAMALPVPRSVPLIYTVLTFLCIGGVRFVFREMVAVGQDRRNERVAIYGAGASGRQLLQSLRQSTQYSPIAFLDDALDAQGTHVGGLHVYAPSMIDTLISKKRVSTVLLAVPSTSPARRSEILRTLEKLPVKLRTVPGLEDVMAGRGGESDLTEVKIEDLLGRDPVPPIPELLGANTLSKVVMVTGAGGSIGSELCRQILAQRPVRLVLFEQSELALYSIDQELTATAQALGIDAPTYHANSWLGAIAKPARAGDPQVQGSNDLPRRRL